jgi:hypothetical protein
MHEKPAAGITPMPHHGALAREWRSGHRGFSVHRSSDGAVNCFFKQGCRK